MTVRLAAAAFVAGITAMAGESWSMTCFGSEARTQVRDYDFWTVAVWTPSSIVTENEGSRNQMVTVEAAVAFSDPVPLPHEMRLWQNGTVPERLKVGETSVVLLGGYEAEPPVWALLALTSPGDDPAATARSCAATMRDE